MHISSSTGSNDQTLEFCHLKIKCPIKLAKSLNVPFDSKSCKLTPDSLFIISSGDTLFLDSGLFYIFSRSPYFTIISLPSQHIISNTEMYMDILSKTTNTYWARCTNTFSSYIYLSWNLQLRTSTHRLIAYIFKFSRQR